MSPFKFSQIKLQILSIALESRVLNDRAFRLLVYLLQNVLDEKSGKAEVEDAELSVALSCSTDTISRAITLIERSQIVEVRRGTWGRISRYSIASEVWEEATRLRLKNRKSAEGEASEQPQNCGSEKAILRDNKPQNCRALLKREKEIKKSRGAPLSSLNSEDQRSHCGNPKIQVAASPAFVPRGICFVEAWNKQLETSGLPRLEKWMIQHPHEGRLGYWLPSRWPASIDTLEWREQFSVLQNQYRQRLTDIESGHVH